MEKEFAKFCVNIFSISNFYMSELSPNQLQPPLFPGTLKKLILGKTLNISPATLVWKSSCVW